MAASRAEAVVARAFGGAVIESAARPGPASHDDRGRRFVFVPASGDAASYALDVESRGTPVPPLLARHLGPTDLPFFDVWTRLEVVAKLTGTPVLALVKEGGIARAFPGDIEVLRVDTPTCWIAVGRRAAA